MSVEDLVRTLMQEFRQIVKTETVVGEPVAVGETVLIPVSKISFGFGAGGGKGKGGGQENPLDPMQRALPQQKPPRRSAAAALV